MSDAGVRKLSALLKKLRAARGEPLAYAPPEHDGPAGDPALHELIFSILLWESTTTQARGAYRRLREAVVDFNELRVCTTEEVIDALGDKYPRARERALRLKSVLNDLFRRTQGLSLDAMRGGSKRDARAFLEALEGIPRFASARVLLLQQGGHAVPCDERLTSLLEHEGIFGPGTDSDTAGGWLEHHVRAEEAVETHLLLQAWCDDAGSAAKERRPKARPSKEAVKKPARPRRARR